MWNGKDSFYCELMCVPAWMGSVSAEIMYVAHHISVTQHVPIILLTNFQCPATTQGLPCPRTRSGARPRSPPSSRR